MLVIEVLEAQLFTIVKPSSTSHVFVSFQHLLYSGSIY